MAESELEMDMEELSSAEDFLEYFGIQYDARVVHVNRLHILQRYHDYLSQVEGLPESEAEQRVMYADLLRGAYEDFVTSNAQTEKVFKVFRMNEPQKTFISLSDLKL